MNDKIKIYQKPTCSKCRTTLSILAESGEEFDSVNYYDTPLTIGELKELIAKLRVTARDILRKDEPSANQLTGASDEELMQAMIDNPDLMQRPIVVRGDQAKICRPPENVFDLLKIKQ